MTYPHRQRAPGQIDCRCGAYASTDADLRAGTWGADCPVAMRERIGELEAESDKRNAQLDAARERIAELEATRSPTLSPAAFDTIVALGFRPGTENPVGWLMGEVRRLQTTLRDLRAQLDYIAHVGWDASCEAAAADALEAEDAGRLNRYAVRVAGERDEARAELAWHEERHGTRAEQEADDAEAEEEWAAVAALSDDDVRALNEAEGIDGPAQRHRFDTFLRVLTRESAVSAKLANAERERDEARAQLATTRRTLSTLDCRYTGAGVADLTGSHCPLGAPCERCAGERERDEARAAALHEAAAVLRGLSNDYAAGHRDHHDYCRVLSVATARIEALTTTTNRSDDAR